MNDELKREQTDLEAKIKHLNNSYRDLNDINISLEQIIVRLDSSNKNDECNRVDRDIISGTLHEFRESVEFFYYKNIMISNHLKLIESLIYEPIVEDIDYSYSELNQDINIISILANYNDNLNYLDNNLNRTSKLLSNLEGDRSLNGESDTEKIPSKLSTMDEIEKSNDRFSKLNNELKSIVNSIESII